MQITLEAARVNVKMTQEEAAKSLKVTKKTISSWENGKTFPKTDKIDAICRLYQIECDNIKWNAR